MCSPGSSQITSRAPSSPRKCLAIANVTDRALAVFDESTEPTESLFDSYFFSIKFKQHISTDKANRLKE